jgi:hypothetical protein
VVDTGGGLLGDTEAVVEHLGVLGVDKGGEVTTVVEDEVELLAILEGEELLLKAPLVLLLGLTLPGEDGDTGSGDSGGGVVLGGEDVAGGPGNLSTEVNEGLDQDGSLDGCERVSSSPFDPCFEATYSCEDNQQCGHRPEAGQHRTSHGWP